MAGVKSRSRVYCSAAALNRGHSEQSCLQALQYVQNIPDFMGFFWPRFLKHIRIINRFVTKEVMKCH